MVYMPRKARIDAPGALHHIIVRGIDRKKIFLMIPTVMTSWIDSAVSCRTVKRPVLHGRL